MHFAMSYSCGKDSTLALHKMLAQGHEPVCLINMFRCDQQRSWFHGADLKLLKEYELNLGIPMLVAKSYGDDYGQVFEDTLRQAKALGATAAVFGDIDLETNRQWEEDRCSNSGLPAHFPLWRNDRITILKELLESNYKCLIKSVSQNATDFCQVGEYMTLSIAEELASAGLDPCGENGEYHTLVIDGPIFKNPINIKCGNKLNFSDHVTISVSLAND